MHRAGARTGPGSIDVIEIDAASHGGVDDARDLRERAFFAPVRDRYKVYIIDEAHMVTTQGFNALLKLVEEPPDFLVFVFATTEPDKVLDDDPLAHPPLPVPADPAGGACARTSSRSARPRASRSSRPCCRWWCAPAAARRATRCRSSTSCWPGPGPEGVTYARAVALLGVTDGALLDDMVDALAAGDAAAVYGTVDRVVEAGHDPRRFSVDLLDRFRDLILLDAVPDAAERGLIDGRGDQLAKMADQALRLGAATLTRYAEIVHTALIEMRGTTSPRLVLELLCARMLLPDAARRRRRAAAAPGAAGAAADRRQRRGRADRRPSRAAQRRSRTASRPGAGRPAARRGLGAARRRRQPRPRRRPRPRVRSARRRPEPAPQPARPQRPRRPWAPRRLRRLWPEVLEVVKEASRRTRALLDNAQITAVDGELVSLGAPAALAKMIAEDSNTSACAAALTKVVGGEWRVAVDGPAPGGRDGCAQRGRAARGSAPEPDPRDDADFEADARPSGAGRSRSRGRGDQAAAQRTRARPLES